MYGGGGGGNGGYKVMKTREANLLPDSKCRMLLDTRSNQEHLRQQGISSAPHYLNCFIWLDRAFEWLELNCCLTNIFDL